MYNAKHTFAQRTRHRAIFENAEHFYFNAAVKTLLQFHFMQQNIPFQCFARNKISLVIQMQSSTYSTRSTDTGAQCGQLNADDPDTRQIMPPST